MGGEFTLSPDMVLGTKAMEVKWLERWGRRWVGFEGDPRLPETVHRERCSYAAWFKHGDDIGINHMAQHLLNRQLSTEVRTNLPRFRLGNSGLGVEKARFEGVTFIDRTCTRCTEGVVSGVPNMGLVIIMQRQPIYSIISCNVCGVCCNAIMRTVVSYTGKLRPWLSVCDARHVGGAHHRSPANMAARAS
ncbi:hypothetical protein HaLaN_33089 [Haematococcus lacustris]|uniref:Uncharacterized protein n=1 Tax=Haematococcus lacustris TaxID=44745 RepID=A0A6A0AN22_HAELA|nr:hypothetical protein HaLaN_33089 [Haematococcus lacustris]